MGLVVFSLPIIQEPLHVHVLHLHSLEHCIQQSFILMDGSGLENLLVLLALLSTGTADLDLFLTCTFPV